MHQNRFRLGLRPTPRWGSLGRSPDSLVGWEGVGAYGASILVPSPFCRTIFMSVAPPLFAIYYVNKLHKIWSVDSQDNH